MPMRLVVMLHRRKSARAAVAASGETPSSAPRSTKRRHAFGAAAEPGALRASADEDDPAVINVGSCRSRGDEVAQSGEEICRIVVIEQGARIKTEALCSRKGGFVDDRAG